MKIYIIMDTTTQKVITATSDIELAQNLCNLFDNADRIYSYQEIELLDM